jgi:hypothetical protein
MLHDWEEGMIHLRAIAIAILLVGALAGAQGAVAQEVTEIRVQVEARNIPAGVDDVLVKCVLCSDESCAAETIVTPVSAQFVTMRGDRSALALDGREGRPSGLFFSFSDAALPGVSQPLSGRSLSEAVWYRCQMFWALAAGGAHVIPGPDVSGPARTAPDTPLRTEVSGPIPR